MNSRTLGALLVTVSAIATVVLCLLAAAALAAPGQLDGSFGREGIASLGQGEANAVLAQPDGRLVVVSTRKIGDDFRVLRLRADGSLDDGFGVGGRATVDFGGEDTAVAAALQPDGRIVVVGWSIDNGYERVAVARLTARGELDREFSAGDGDGDGTLMLPLVGGQDEHAQAVALDAQGRIVVTGYRHWQATGDDAMLTVRLLADGTVESTTTTLVPVPFEADFGGGAQARAIAILPGGEIAVAGEVRDVALGEVAVARFRPDGRLDSGFGGVGMRVFGPGQARAEGLIAQPDGKLVTISNDGEHVLTRLNRDGGLDGSFGSGGVARSSFGGGGALGAELALAPDGKLVTVGAATVPGRFELAAARFLPGGAPDPGFGDGGQTRIASDRSAIALSLALAPDGGIVLGGTRNGELIVARLEGDPPPPPPPPVDGGGTPPPGAPGGGPAGGGGLPSGDGRAPADRTSPRLSRVRVTVLPQARGRSGARGRRAAWAEVRFVASEPARVRLRLTATPVRGARGGSAGRGGHPGRALRAFAPRSLTVSARAGANRVLLRGGRPPRGSYRLALVAIDTVRNTGRAVNVRLAVGPRSERRR